MRVVVISYKPNWEKRCARGCHCEGSGDSSLEVQNFPDRNAAADYIAGRLVEDDGDRDFRHLVAESYEGVLAACNVSPWDQSGAASIGLGGLTEEEGDYLGDRCDDVQTAYVALVEGMRVLVGRKVVAIKKGKQEAERLQAEAEKADRERRQKDEQEMRDQMEFMRLKLKYEPPKA